MCFLLTVYAEAVIVTRQKREANEMDSIDNFEPRAKYLQQWSQKFTELNEIPQCKVIHEKLNNVKFKSDSDQLHFYKLRTFRILLQKKHL